VPLARLDQAQVAEDFGDAARQSGRGIVDAAGRGKRWLTAPATRDAFVMVEAPERAEGAEGERSDAVRGWQKEANQTCAAGEVLEKRGGRAQRRGRGDEDQVRPPRRRPPPPLHAPVFQSSAFPTASGPRKSGWGA